jgi:hypothetical protein
MSLKTHWYQSKVPRVVIGGYKQCILNEKCKTSHRFKKLGR